MINGIRILVFVFFGVMTQYATGFVSHMQNEVTEKLEQEFGEKYYQGGFLGGCQTYHPVSREQSHNPCVSMFEPGRALHNGVVWTRMDTYPANRESMLVYHVVYNGKPYKVFDQGNTLELEVGSENASVILEVLGRHLRQATAASHVEGD